MESSAKPASVAVMADGELLGQYYQNSGLTHSRTLLGMTESLISNLEIPLAKIDLIAVANGPGSFTGVRIGVSAAKGLAWGMELPVCGVSTLEAMAYQAAFDGVIVCPVMDARQGQVYNALFKWENGDVYRMTEDRAISLEDLAFELNSKNEDCLLLGDGAKIAMDSLTDAGVKCKIAPALLRNQTAYGVALAARYQTPTTAINLEPNYLRPSQAERALGR